MKFVLFVTLIWSILDSGWSITDEDLVRMEAGLSQIQVLTNQVQDLRKENQAGQTQIQALTVEMKSLKEENKELRQFKTEQQTVNKRLLSHLEAKCGCDNDFTIDLNERNDPAQNTTVEDRVLILEAQMAEVQEEVLQLQDQVAVVFDEQVLQDERILTLEQETEGLEERVEELEENGGGGGNVTALEVRVETLEGTAVEHEADLQVTDVELDLRIADLEERADNETTIAFQAVMNETDDDDIPNDSTVIFSDVQLNVGNGYDPATGVFTVPSGGEGYYYFATHFRVNANRVVYIDIRVNDVTTCTAFDSNQEINDQSSSGCSTVVFLLEGDEVWNIYRDGTDSIPAVENSDGIYNGFTGFRI